MMNKNVFFLLKVPYYVDFHIFIFLDFRGTASTSNYSKKKK